MGWQDWVELKSLQTICKHTVVTSAAILSFVIISWLVRRAVGPGVLGTMLESIEKFLLAVMFLVFVFNIGYDFWKEIRRNVGSNKLVAA